MSKKVAFFGGTGGQYSPYSPGGSPVFRGGPSGNEGYGVNDFGADLGLDTIMSRNNKPYILGFERSLESLLETFHEDLESDCEKYLLDFDERLKLDLKRKIRKKEQHLKNLKKEIQEEQKEKNKKIVDLEDLLESRRKNKDKDFSKNASKVLADFSWQDSWIDEIPIEEQLKNQQVNKDSYYRNTGSLPLLDQTLPSVEEYDAEGDELNLTKNRLTNVFLGNDIEYRPEDGIDEYLKNLTNQYYPTIGHADFDGLINSPNEDQIGFHNADGELFDLPSQINPDSNNSNKSLTQRLDSLKKRPGIGRLDPNMFNTLDYDRILRGLFPDQGGGRNTANDTAYNNDTFGTIENITPFPAGGGAYPLAGYI